MSDPSRIYFPLRSNAYALLAGKPAASVRARIIHGALLYDEVFVDAGMWEGRSGPTGSMEMRFPLGTFDSPATLQTPQARGRAARSEFYVAAKPSDSPGPAHRIITSETTIAWRATFDSILRDVPHGYKWLHAGIFDLYPDDKKVVARMVTQDQRDGALADMLPDEFPRKLVIGSANFNLVLGSRMEATVSMDSIHSRALAARIARGQASPVLGAGALAIAFPGTRDLTWEDIDAARRLRGMRNLRARLREIEEAAREVSIAGGPIDTAILAKYNAALQIEIDKLRPSFRGAILAVLLGAGMAVVTGPLPLALGIVGGVAQVSVGSGVARLRYERSWMAAANQLGKLFTRNSDKSQATDG